MRYEKPEERRAGVVLRLPESAAEMVAQTVPAFESLATATGSSGLTIERGWGVAGVIGRKVQKRSGRFF